ncbi:hypothetical protein FOA52_009546 [Chlamydomonas sp. UWO 241]|nr:hypothetical protein FOA52_009546 [Chlamydomonas sp. UWO 241]
MSLDVVNKLGRYDFQGGASNHPSPRLPHYYGEASVEHERCSAHGAAALADVMAAPVPDDDDHGGCPASFKAACMESKHTGPGNCDITGMLGGTCSHGAPVAGTFIDLDTSENFTYYLLCMLSTIAAALDAGKNIGDIYIDFGCKLKKTWARYVDTLEEREEITSELAHELSQVRVLVDWLHANTHDLKCQLENRGRFTTGAHAATVVGEMTEQLWAMTKRLGNIVRYFGKAQRRDWVEGRLHSITGRTRVNIVRLLDKKFKDTQGLKNYSAAAARVADLEAARTSFLEHMKRLKLRPDNQPTEMEYVRLLVLVKELTNLNRHGAWMAVVSPELTFSLMGNVKGVEEANRKLKQLEVDLGIRRSSRWEPTTAAFQDHLKKLKEREIRR